MLSSNHKHNLIATLLVTEEMIDELSCIISSKENTITYKIEKDLSEEEIINLKESIKKLKKKLKEIVKKHNLDIQQKRLRKIVNTLQVFCRIDLRETFSAKLIGSGRFTPEEKPEEFDADLKELMVIINNLLPDRLPGDH